MTRGSAYREETISPVDLMTPTARRRRYEARMIALDTRIAESLAAHGMRADDVTFVRRTDPQQWRRLRDQARTMQGLWDDYAEGTETLSDGDVLRCMGRDLRRLTPGGWLTVSALVLALLALLILLLTLGGN